MEFIGILHRIGEIENTNGPAIYAKRPFYLKYIDSKNKEQLVKFVFYDPQLDVINNFQLNEKVKINFDFKGLDSAKTGKFFEEKIALSIISCMDLEGKNKKTASFIPSTGEVKPDFTRTYDEFPEELIY
jgi:hypothetical protein